MHVYHDFASPLSRLAVAGVAAWVEARKMARGAAAEGAAEGAIGEAAEGAAEGAGGEAKRGGEWPRWVPFELAPAGAAALDPADPAFAAQIEAARERASEWGVEVRVPSVVPRTGKAHEAVAFAGRAVERGDAEPGLDMRVVTALYDALWRDGRDIGRLDVIVDVASGAGVDVDTLYVALGLDDLAAEVSAEQAAAEVAGVEGVPTLVRPTSPGEADVLVGLVERKVLEEWLSGAESSDTNGEMGNG